MALPLFSLAFLILVSWCDSLITNNRHFTHKDDEYAAYHAHMKKLAKDIAFHCDIVKDKKDCFVFLAENIFKQATEVYALQSKNNIQPQDNSCQTEQPQRVEPENQAGTNVSPRVEYETGANSEEDISFEKVPSWGKTAFLTVKEMVAKIIKEEDRYRIMSETVVYDDVQKLLVDPVLGDIAKQLVKDTPFGLWRTTQLVNGCCPLLKFHAANETLVNINGLARRIVHFKSRKPPRYQFIQHGVCVPYAKSLSAESHITCTQGSLTMPLLIWDTSNNPPFSFDLFQIPTHCICYNV